MGAMTETLNVFILQPSSTPAGDWKVHTRAPWPTRSPEPRTTGVCVWGAHALLPPPGFPAAQTLPGYLAVYPGFPQLHRKRGDTKMSAPSMKERKACWDSRDEYWKCLDENLEDTTKCETFKGAFEKTCPQQWVKYFNRRREYLKYKAMLETKGFEPLAPNKS